MPLNTQALSPARQALMLVVLLLFFVASLGLAQVIVLTRAPAGAAPSALFPALELKGFTPYSPDLGTSYPPFSASHAEMDGGQRELFIFRYPLPPAPGDPLEAETLVLYEALAGMPPTQISASRFSPERGVADALGPTADSPGFVLLRATATKTEFFAIVYRGTTPPTPQDVANYKTLTGRELRVSAPSRSPRKPRSRS